jgi:hypothetical protein
MFPFVYAAGEPLGRVSTEARVLTLLCGVGLCFLALVKLRRRSLLAPTCSLFLAVGGVFILFAVFPNAFDRLSYLVGVKYPPVLYLMACVFALMLMIIHLAARMSVLDERCRRMAQEMALREAAGRVGDTGVPPGPSSSRGTQPS